MAAQVCRHLGESASLCCTASDPQKSLESGKHNAGLMAWGSAQLAAPQGSPMGMEHTGTLGLTGEEPKKGKSSSPDISGTEMEICPPHEDIWPHTSLSEDPACSAPTSPDVAEICSAHSRWAAAPCRTSHTMGQTLLHRWEPQRDQHITALPLVLQMW